MTSFFIALRSAVYATSFVFLWGWIALGVRRSFGEWIELPPMFEFIGVTCMTTGGAIVLWCLTQFLLVGRGTPAPFDAPTTLVTTGPYRYVRNPMYLGASLVLLGFGFYNLSATIACFTIAFLLLAHVFVLLYEEPTLERQFGSRFQAYKILVNRWLPKKLRQRDQAAS